jgi:hypothetical protein
MTQKVDCHYHIFGLARENKKNIEVYVAEGPTTAISPECPMKEFAEFFISSHGLYLQDLGIPTKNMELALSFNPTYEKAIDGGVLYSARKLSKEKEREFLSELIKFIQTYCT